MISKVLVPIAARLGYVPEPAYQSVIEQQEKEIETLKTEIAYLRQCPTKGCAVKAPE